MPRPKSLVVMIRNLVQKEIGDAIGGLLGTSKPRRKAKNGRRKRRGRRRGPGRPKGSKNKNA